MTTKFTWNAKLEQQIHDQRKWIKEHGDNLGGYIARYGSVQQEHHYGDGAEAIFKADDDALTALLAQRKTIKET